MSPPVFRSLSSGLRYQLSGLALPLLLAFAGCATAPTEYREPAPLAGAALTQHNLAVFDRVWGLVNDKYFDPKFHGVDWNALREKYRPLASAAPDENTLYDLLNRMNAELKESHLIAITPRRAHEFDTEHKAAVGIRWQLLEAKRVVDDVIPGGPAALAGVQPGWLVVSRDGRPIPASDRYVSHLGEPVTYGFLDLHDQPHSFTFVPRLLDFVRREARVLPGGALYLRFDEFDPASIHWLSGRLKELRPTAGVIVDLRSNPGGNVFALNLAIAEFFDRRVPEGRIIRRNGTDRETHSFSWLSAHYAGPVVLLTSGRTGSAAEIFAHVLQFNDRAKIVGQKTAGAVIYSRRYGLPSDGILQVPVMDYVGLDGQRIEGRGVTPDILVPPPTLADLRTDHDSALIAALNLLQATGSTTAK